ncbi:hypothetical protein NADE_007191 [Nannochloris sp. 'desiccata']|nr:hypothetical protein KSW81_002660 [Chlorella desiccata (nom. nud.)]KAH7617413.1 hypothetical protein NADE_007191 [Chlorella desiccata (nom. nud.)]
MMKRKASPSTRVCPGRGRPASHNLRALIAIGIRLAIPLTTLEAAVDMVNCVCNNFANEWHPAAREEDICAKTLKNRVQQLMNNVTWRSIKSDQEASSRPYWAGIVASHGAFIAESINDLTREACDRMVIFKDYKNNKSKKAIEETAREVAQEERQELINYEINQENTIYTDHHVDLAPQGQEQQQQFQQFSVGRVVDGGGGGCEIPHQLEDFKIFSLYNDLEMHNNKFGIVDDGIDYDFLCRNMLPLDEEFLLAYS